MPERRPRTRGGHPQRNATTQDPEESSPHTRGSSPEPAAASRVDKVVPAHAGVIPWSPIRRTTTLRRPRTRGGHPYPTLAEVETF